MPSPIEIVQAFLAECGKSKEALGDAFRRYFTPTTVWENVGLATTTGADEALALMAGLEARLGVTAMAVETLLIAALGEKVLTERIDHFLKPDGTVALSVRVAGIFEVECGKIVAWRDYFDGSALSGGAPPG